MLTTCGLQAATITYSLTTHVDGRTITGTASLNAGASLLDNMPQALWRADCEYTYYSDAAMTQPITVAPSENATVYVDYVFFPDFVVSTPDNVQYYMVNAYISTTKLLMYSRPQTNNNNALIGATKTGSTSNPKSYFAFFGDAYCMKIMAKERHEITRWITGTNSASSGAVIASPDESQAAVFQFYESAFEVGDRQIATRVFAIDDAHVLYYNNIATTPQGEAMASGASMAPGAFQITSSLSQVGDAHWNSKHKLVGSQGGNSTALSNASFFATFTNTSYVTTYLNYRILKANGTWNPDLVVSAQNRTGKVIAWPSGYSRKAHCNYEYYYQDGDFLVKYPDDYLVPTDKSIVIYIKETYKRSEPFQKGKWITITVPYNIGVSGTGDNKDFETWFGATDPVKVLELYDYELNGNKYDLKFRYTTKMEASKPYLFKAVNVPDLGQMCLAMNDQDPQETWIKETVVTGDGADVTMRGTYEGVTLKNEDQSANKLFAFLAYNSAGDINFYRINEKRSSFNITPYRCYFTFTDPTGAGTLSVLNMSIKEDMVDAIGEVIATAEVEPLTGTYDLMGRKVDASNMRRGIYVVNGRKVVK
ncbi:MAG: hypothetical protein ILA39_01360 [Bacteroidaceae bacterium]|nr:hypothetical protein [Bacteroidaceae bacterium]